MNGLLRNVAVTAIAVAFVYWLLGHYDAALRDPRFFDGWILFAAMAVQILFHLRKKLPSLPLGKAASWLKLHVYGGYFVIAVFGFHTGFSLPDAPFEWVLWALFILVAVSGAIGAYLSWSFPAKLDQGAQPLTFERIPVYRFELAREMDDLARNSVGQIGSLAISDFYVNRLHAFFRKPRNRLAHLRHSRRPLGRICSEIDGLEPYVDTGGRNMLRAIKGLVVAKDRLDFQYAHQSVLQTWLFVHIPATYCLIVLSLLHVAIVEAFSSGVP